MVDSLLVTQELQSSRRASAPGPGHRGLTPRPARRSRLPGVTGCARRTAPGQRIVGAMLKTPERYLDEIRARELRIFYRGQRFANPVDHPVAAPAARCVAETYAAALEPDSGMAVESPLVREPVNVSNLLWT